MGNTIKYLLDWQYYIKKYPDLENAGIDNEKKAKNHWERRGKSENRFCCYRQEQEETGANFSELHTLPTPEPGQISTPILEPIVNVVEPIEEPEVVQEVIEPVPEVVPEVVEFVEPIAEPVLSVSTLNP